MSVSMEICKFIRQSHWNVFVSIRLKMDGMYFRGLRGVLIITHWNGILLFQAKTAKKEIEHKYRTIWILNDSRNTLDKTTKCTKNQNILSDKLHNIIHVSKHTKQHKSTHRSSFRIIFYIPTRKFFAYIYEC